MMGRGKGRITERGRERKMGKSEEREERMGREDKGRGG